MNLELVLSQLENNTITHLELANKLEQGQINQLLTALTTNTSVTYINLANNRIDIRYVTKLAQALTNKQNLTFLSLDRNFLEDNGIKAILEQLQDKTLLQTLFLSSTGCGDAGAEKIAAFLQNNTSLSCLTLNSNLINPQGAENIAQALTHNFSLKSLSLKFNLISPEIDNRITDILENNTLIKLKEEKQFIEQVITILQGATDNNNFLSLLPIEIIAKIFQQVNVEQKPSAIENLCVLAASNLRNNVWHTVLNNNRVFQPTGTTFFAKHPHSKHSTEEVQAELGYVRNNPQ